jgi:hypothetical protein
MSAALRDERKLDRPESSPRSLRLSREAVAQTGGLQPLGMQHKRGGERRFAPPGRARQFWEMSDQRSSATATGRERIALAVSGGVVLVFVLLDRLWLALAAFVVVLAVVVVQQRRENRDRRAAIDRLKTEHPSMTEPERREALRGFRERFPALAARRELDRYVAGLGSGEERS